MNNTRSCQQRVTEEEYRKIVRDRRKREEFVVDDDNTGYYDDGEEHWDADTSGSVSAPHGKKSMSLNSRQSAEKGSRSRARGALTCINSTLLTPGTVIECGMMTKPLFGSLGAPSNAAPITVVTPR